MCRIQPSLRDLCNREMDQPNLKGWAIVGSSLRDESLESHGIGLITRSCGAGMAQRAPASKRRQKGVFSETRVGIEKIRYQLPRVARKARHSSSRRDV